MAQAASLFTSAEFDTPPVPAATGPRGSRHLAAEVSVCRRCPHLADTRTQTVFGTGSAATRLMFIGEAPGADEDRLGEPFVGRAGQLLTDMITKGMGLGRDQVYIANILKCRPPENRTPTVEEADNCFALSRTANRHHPARVSLPARQGGRPGATVNTDSRWARPAASGTATAAFRPSSRITPPICCGSRNSRRKRGKTCRCS